MYQGFYESITRQIEELYRAQSEIRGNISHIIRNRNSSIHPDVSGNSHRQFGTTTTSNNQRVYIDGQPYILEYQHQYIPFNQRNNWSDSSYNYSSHHYADTSGNLGQGYNALNFLQQFYSNVPVLPNSQQILDGTLIGPFCQMVTPTNTSCPISLEPFEDNTNVTQIRGCGHIFHSDHIQAWFRTSPRCPVCRYDIRDYIYFPTTYAPDASGNQVDYESGPGPEDETEAEPSLETTINNEEQSQNTPSLQPNSIPQNRNEERNSNPNLRPLSTGANLTGMILNQLFSSVTRNRANFNNTQYTYDPSNNEIILEGFLRAFE
jgi:hypothetical protein